MNAVLFFSVWSSACRHFVTILTCFSTEKTKLDNSGEEVVVLPFRTGGYEVTLFYLESILSKPA